MRADILILGQGLAGTMLAWELERAGLAFQVVDPGLDRGATTTAAGLINPVTGRRFVKSWRIEEFWPLAMETYRTLEAELGGVFWRGLRIERRWADERERRLCADRVQRGVVAPYVTLDAVGGEQCTIAPAARVDLPGLLGAARARWRAQGRLREEPIDPAEAERYACVIDCTGLAGTGEAAFGFVPWEFSKGEVLEIAVGGLAPDVAYSCGHALVPLTAGRAWVGATHVPAGKDRAPTPAARAALAASATALLGREFTVVAQRAAVRVNLPDKRPVAGWQPGNARRGLVNALGAKGVLWSPFLAQQWRRHLTDGAAFDPEIDVARFAPTGGRR